MSDESDREYDMALYQVVVAAREFLAGRGSLDGLRSAIDRFDLAELDETD